MDKHFGQGMSDVQEFDLQLENIQKLVCSDKRVAGYRSSGNDAVYVGMHLTWFVAAVKSV